MKNLKKDIEQKQFHRVYLLYGPESYLRIRYRDLLTKAILPNEGDMNLNIMKADSITEQDIIDQAETLPFFADMRVIRLDDTGLFKLKLSRGDAFRKPAELLPDYLAKIPETTVIIFNEENVDKRSRMYKAVQKYGLAVEFKEADEKTLTAFVLKMLAREGLRIRPSTMEYFLNRTGNDMNHIRRETDKLIHYIRGCGDAEEVTREDIEAIVSDRIENRIFEMITDIAASKTKEALSLYADLLAGKEPPMRILSLITREFNNLLLIKEMSSQGESRDAIAKAAGMPPFAVRKSMDLLRSYTNEQLERAVKLCIQSDEDIKNGKITDRMAVELIILHAGF